MWPLGGSGNASAGEAPASSACSAETRAKHSATWRRSFACAIQCAQAPLPSPDTCHVTLSLTGLQTQAATRLQGASSRTAFGKASVVLRTDPESVPVSGAFLPPNEVCDPEQLAHLLQAGLHLWAEVIWALNDHVLSAAFLAQREALRDASISQRSAQLPHDQPCSEAPA